MTRSTYLFCTGFGRLSRMTLAAARKVADEEDVSFTYVAPSRRWSGNNWWFSTENLGEPFNSATAIRVAARLPAEMR